MKMFDLIKGAFMLFVGGFVIITAMYVVSFVLLKLYAFFTNPKEYKRNKGYKDDIPSLGQFIAGSVDGAIRDSANTDRNDRLSADERSKLNDALRTAEMYKYSNTHRYFGKDKK
jgi:hypothetical protein